MSVIVANRRRALARSAQDQIELLEWRIINARRALGHDKPTLAWAYLSGRREVSVKCRLDKA